MTNRTPEVREEPEDVLVQTLFHKTLLLFHVPSTWPVWKVALGLFVPLMTVTVIWWLATDLMVAALSAGFVLALFFIADALLLRSLPALRVSFGPWQSQLFALSVPRSAIAVIISVVAIIAGVGWGLLVLVVAQLIGLGALIYGAMVEPFRLQLTYLNVESDRMPVGTEPIRILHVSDLHVERLTRREEKLLELIEQVQADLIVITGDYLNLSYVYDPVAQDDVCRLLSRFSAPYGVYATLGSPPVDERDVVPELFDGLPIRLLVDEWEVVELEGNRQLLLLGMDCSHHLLTDRQKLRQLVAESPNTMPNVLLYHAPDLMPEATGHGIDVYLCGHTHGGQVRLPGYGALLTSSQLGKQFEMGLYRNGRTYLYVSRGVGLEGLSAPRVRFLAPPEITLVTISGRASQV